MTDQPKPRLCAHADDGGGAHVLAAGETCDRASTDDTLTRATALAEFVLRWYDVREKTRGGDQ